MRRILLPLFVFIFCLAAIPTQAQWKLIWSDEFDETIGPDWTYHVGAAWNNELQYYRKENASVVDSNLVITAQKEAFGGKNYTSARLRTQGKISWKYGRLEARIKLPVRQGSWPAFWTLGDVGQWPKNGEIDILEHVNTSNIVQGNMHWSNNGTHTMREKRTTADVSGYNVYAIEWSPVSIKWFLNNVKFHEVSILNSVINTEAFHKKHHIILNLAVGGDMPGMTIDEENMPWTMLVDYVRVYADTTLVSATGVSITPASHTLVKNTFTTLTATVLPENATHKTVSWSSSNPTIATVSATGVVVGKSPGTVTITAKTADLVATSTITVTDVNTSVEEFSDEMALYPNPVTNGMLKVDMGNLTGSSTLRVIDLNGRMYSQQIHNDASIAQMPVDVPAGIYVLQIINNEQIFTKRFSVVR